MVAKVMIAKESADSPKPVTTGTSAPARARGRQRVPDAKRRVILSTRVLPDSKEYLENMGYENVGRAIDACVAEIKRKKNPEDTLGILTPTQGVMRI